MIRPINRDPLFLAQKSAPATPEDAPIARDSQPRNARQLSQGESLWQSIKSVPLCQGLSL